MKRTILVLIFILFGQFTDQSQEVLDEIHHTHDHHDHHEDGNAMDRNITECLRLLNSEKNHLEDDDDNHRTIVDLRLWISACVSIMTISLCGIFGVLVIPIMQKVFYQYLLQFLVALAIGSMLGDAFLHLIPHAFSIRNNQVHHHYHDQNAEDDDEHSRHIWIGFIGLMALVVFFILEKLINMFGEWREKNRVVVKEKELQVIRSGHKASNRAIGEKLCMHKYSAYCVSDFENIDRVADLKDVTQATHLPLINSKDNNELVCNSEDKFPKITQSATVITSPQDSVEAPGITECFENWKAESESILSPSLSALNTVFVREHEHSHHGHSHAHSHLHSAPDSIASVAWMVIVGDGIHNLADGMAVGAAFSEDFISGLSTSIAVLCHELPHEVGDFAMLLKAGMSLKQALLYNILSSFLAFLGMIAGILLGNIEHFTPWIFMGTAGVFMYVALVDMIPELNSGHAHPFTSKEQREARSIDFISQILGLTSGISIMLVIALFEDSFKSIFA